MKQFDSDKDKYTPLHTDWEKGLRSRLNDDERTVPECAWENILEQMNTPNNKSSYWELIREQWGKVSAAVLLLIMFSIGGLLFFDIQKPPFEINRQSENHSSTQLFKEDGDQAINNNAVFHSQNNKRSNSIKTISNTNIHIPDLPNLNELQNNHSHATSGTNDFIDNNKFHYNRVNEPHHELISLLPIPLFHSLVSVTSQQASENVNKILSTSLEALNEPIKTKLHWFDNENQSRIKRWAFGTSLGTGTYRDDINTTRDVSFTSMKETVDGEMISFKRMRDTVSIQEQTNLSPIWSYQAGFLVSYALSKRLSLQSGAQYTLQKTSRTGEYILRNVEQGHTLAPTTIPINDTTVYELEKYDLEMPQTLHYIGLPVRLTLRIGGEKWNVTTSGGFLLNYLADAPIPSSRQIKKKGVPTIFNPWHLSGLFAIGIQYQLNNQYAVALEPNLRFSITSMTRDQVESSYPHSIGVSLSIVRNL